MSKRIFTSPEQLKKIAIYKSAHPEISHAKLAKKFGVEVYQARYAIKKYAEDTELMRGTKKGMHVAAKMLHDSTDEVELMKQQLQLCLNELEVNQKITVKVRLDLLYKASRIRQFVQSVELEAHMNRADAELIARIVRRYTPNASNDDVIKIYNEEIAKWKMEKAEKKL